MWQVLRTQSYPEFDNAANDLLQSTTRTLIVCLGGAYLAWHVVATASWPVELGWKVWTVTGMVVLPGALALVLLPRHLVMAQLIWLAGLVAAITQAVLVFQQPEIALFYALMPLVAIVIMGWWAGLLVQGGVTALLWWLAGSEIGMALPVNMVVAVIVGGAIAWLLGWAAMHTLTTVAQWALFSFSQAQQHLEAAQKHRAQLAQMFKDLDHAYYRLERANAALVAARKVAEDAERFKAEFVTNISHELRTPLNLIVGFSEVMMTAPQSYKGIQLPGAYRRDLNAIYRSAQHLLALVDDVLDLARIEAGKIALAHEDVDLAALVVEAADTMRDYIGAKGLTLHLNLASDLPRLWIDRVRTRQVLLNLLVNAARFTRRGGIQVSVSRQADEIYVGVQDSGSGIAEEDLSKIFDAFRSTEQPASTWHSGTGLGLPISKKFVELHHGRMGVESVVGQGTTVWFTLPCASTPAAAPSTARSGRWTPSVRLGASERIIVVAHDDPQVATFLKRHLEGYQVVGIADVAEGAAVAEELRAIALVMDGRRAVPPGMSTMPVVCCPLPSSRQTAIALGAEDILVKPVSREKLLAAIDALGRPIRRLLVADDDPDMVRLLQRMLSTRAPAPECLVAHNGIEALEVLRQQPVDLVLLDLAMPGLNGRGVLDELALDPTLMNIPVLIISAQEQEYTNLRLTGAIQVVRSNGFRLGEIIQTLEALFHALSPGWRQLETTASEHAEAQTG